MTARAPTVDTAPTLAMVAGEASGDLLASLMIRGLRARWPHAKLVGIGGPRMAEQGFQAWWPHEKLAVRGYVEVLRHYREIVGIRSQLKARLLAAPPQIFVGVDAPDFNLDLARDLRQSGIPTVQFVCPSIWAWRAERVEKNSPERGPRAVPFPLRARVAGATWHCGHLCGPSAGANHCARAQP